MSTDITDELIPTDGYRTRVLRAGAGNEHPIILLHGGGPGADAGANYPKTLAGLSDELDVVAIDLVGFGTTDHPADPPHGAPAWQALRLAQIEGVMDHYGFDRATLVGNSLGGAITLNFTLQRPERVDKIVLMGSAGPPFQPGAPLIQLTEFYDDPSEERLKAILTSFVYDLDDFGDIDPLISARFASAMREEARRSFTTMYRTAGGQAARDLAFAPEVIAGIEHPAMIIHGREDQIIPLAGSQWLLEHLPNADLHVLGHCGHWAMLERPVTFNRLVREFVTGRDVGAVRTAGSAT
jgi:2-hydroxymuconate-semialdehyde hydrolase